MQHSDSKELPKQLNIHWKFKQKTEQDTEQNKQKYLEWYFSKILGVEFFMKVEFFCFILCLFWTSLQFLLFLYLFSIFILFLDLLIILHIDFLLLFLRINENFLFF